MRRILSTIILLLAACGALADINITNVPVATNGYGTGDKLLGVTNSTHTALMEIKFMNQLAAAYLLGSSNAYLGSFTGNGSGITNLTGVAMLSSNQVFSGTNTFSTNVVLNGAINFGEVTRPGTSPTNTIYMWVEDAGGLPALRIRDWNGLVLGVVRDNVWIGRCATPGGISRGDAVYNAGVAGTNMVWIDKAQANSTATIEHRPRRTMANLCQSD